MMERKTAIQKRIGLLTRLAIYVAKWVTVSKSVLKEPLKMTTMHLSQAKAQKEVILLRKESSNLRRGLINNLLNSRPKSKKTKTCQMMRNIPTFNSWQCPNLLNK